MIRRQNELGEIAVSNNVYTYIAGSAATNCFGVKGMAIRSICLLYTSPSPRD